jgi:hypothetical protein
LSLSFGGRKTMIRQGNFAPNPLETLVGPEFAIEIPPATKRRLGLDAEGSWLITTELNRFIWPGPDIRALPSGEYSHGYLPGRLLQAALDQVRAHSRKNRLQSLTRDEPSV